jgi:ketosteroid isomerase-like protein
MAIAMAVFAMFVFAAGCSRSTPEQALRKDLSALQSAIEARDAGALRDFLADDFVGNDGLDRDGARRMAAVLFMRNRDIGTTVGPLDVVVQGEHATVRCTVVLTGGDGGLLPRSGSVYNVTSGWRMQEGSWKMTSVAWRQK